MKDIPENPFYGGSLSMQRKKRITFYTIVTTLAAIALTLAILLVTLLVIFIGGLAEDEPEVITDIGDTETVPTSPEMLSSGILLPLDNNTSTSPLSTLVNLEKYENRAKTRAGTNAFTVGNKPAFYGARDAVEALNRMLGDFYNATGDDNIYIANAYDTENVNMQGYAYKLGTAFELKYFSAADVQDWSKKDSIYGVALYNWVYENAHRYGFLTLSEIDGNANETNVFRYVGVVHSEIMKQKHLSLSAYWTWLKTYTPEKPYFIGNDHAVYYQKNGEAITLPTAYGYSVSGNSSDGYAITVEFN